MEAGQWGGHNGEPGHGEEEEPGQGGLLHAQKVQLELGVQISSTGSLVFNTEGGITLLQGSIVG